MSKLFLIPVISIFDIHDAATREWLNTLDENSILPHLDYPFRLDRFFPESEKHALICADNVHREVLYLLEIINPQAIFLDISTDFYELENKYNKRLKSPQEFWSEYYETFFDLHEPARTIYRIYIKEIIDRNIRLIESKDRLPLSVVFYGMDRKSREELIPVYEEIYNRNDEFLLQAARAVNEITSFHVLPKHIWYSPLKLGHAAVSYEETERFYNELSYRLGRMLAYRLREYVVKRLSEQALAFTSSYEKFLDHKAREDGKKFSNIIDGLNVLAAQSDYPAIVILCEPMSYFALLDYLKKDKRLPSWRISMEESNITALLDKMKPFLQKNRIMQINYEIALNVLGRKKPDRYNNPGAVLLPSG